jgi:hypothetical protein
VCDALIRSGSIEVLDRGMQDTMQLILLEDEKVIETLSMHAAQKPFTDRLGAFRMLRRGEHLDAALSGKSAMSERRGRVFPKVSFANGYQM